MKRICVFQSVIVKENFLMGSMLKDLGSYTLSLRIEFFCFYCKLFSICTTSALSANGFSNWSNLHTRLYEHENSKNHLEATCQFWELHQRLFSRQTIDKECELTINKHAKVLAASIQKASCNSAVSC